MFIPETKPDGAVEFVPDSVFAGFQGGRGPYSEGRGHANIRKIEPHESMDAHCYMCSPRKTNGARPAGPLALGARPAEAPDVGSGEYD